MAKQDNSAKKGSPTEEPQIEMGSMSQIRTLVAINQRKNLEASLAHLERNYYQLHIVNRIPDLIRGLQAHRPQIVLLSWNLKNTDVKKVYRLLTQKFHLICVVFAEDAGTRSTASLMSSGIPNSLLAPVSGPSMHTRIQSLLAPRLRPRKRPIAPAELFKRPNMIEKEKVPTNLEWIEVADKNGEKMWQGVSFDGGKDQGGIYYFKGPTPPLYDNFRKEWNLGSDPKGGLFFQERAPASPDLSAVQEGLSSKELKMTTSTASGEMLEATSSAPTPLDTDFDWESALKEAEREISDAVKEVPTDGPLSISVPPTDTGVKEAQDGDAKGNGLGDIISISTDIHSRNPQAGETILAQCLRSAFTQNPGKLRDPVNEKNAISKMTVCTITSERFCGYLVCVSSDNAFQREYMQGLIPSLAAEMKNAGELLSGAINILELEVGAVPFGPWTESKADFSISSRKTGLSIAFFSTKDQPQIIEAEDESVLGITLERDILGNVPLLFNIYIHLPKNNKYLLYLHNGQVFTKKTIEKFLNYGIRTVYIRKTEKEMFLTYCAKNFINSSLK